MGTRTTLPPAPAEPRTAILSAGNERAYGRIERCGPSYVLVRTALTPALGEPVHLRIPSTCFGELQLDGIARWQDRNGALALQLCSLRPRDLVALRRLVPSPEPDGRLAVRRRGYRVDGRIDPFAPTPDRTMPLDGVPVSLILVNGELEGVATTLEDERAVVHAWIDLRPGSHVALRVFEDELFERWQDVAMVVVKSERGVHELSRQQSRWASPA
ncbi:hypothetical protein [Sandaracinus amylolyticus]|uniref:hypothetical protein n=1 Tax=Sandaracinus amylolyticus TaxID=927083 RepID=UPI0012EDA563|nr:hypothetical protein [Sandaracinus amylolyticus]